MDAPAGTLVFLADPAVKRYASAAEPDTTVLAMGGEPGKHDVSAWEWFFAAYAYADEGEHEKAIAELMRGLEERPDASAAPLPPRLRRGARRHGATTRSST